MMVRYSNDAGAWSIWTGAGTQVAGKGEFISWGIIPQGLKPNSFYRFYRHD